MLGDIVSDALQRVGITEDKVTQWLRQPCRCKERQEKLNLLGRWAIVSVHSSTVKAEQWLRNLLYQPGD